MPGLDRQPITVLPPMTAEAMRAQGYAALDFVYVVGDAYIDHPSFGAAIITRVLQHNGFSVGVISQPEYRDASAFRRLGRPKLAFLVSSGNLDSMVNHYSVTRHRRAEDAYTPGGKPGRRPDRAVIVYANRCREAYHDVPVIIGGIEASLRRFAHYDYWDDKVRHSILYDACADLLLYGMGERSIVETARLLDAGTPADRLRDIRGSCYRAASAEGIDGVLLPSFDEVKTDRHAYARAFMQQYREQDAQKGRTLIQPHEKGVLVQNPPALPLTTAELDAVYALPFTRQPHPDYREHIPALDEVAFSITSARGCFGGCHFCALTFHQGRVISARSHASILAEAGSMTRDPAFRGYIHDVGGPTANFRQPACKKQLTAGVCSDRDCIGYSACRNLSVSHIDYVQLLRKLRALPGVKKVFIRSGVRYDYVLYDKDDTFLQELVRYHVSGQLKIAPEHISDRALYYMNKPAPALYERFLQKYDALNRRYGLKQYVVPYLMSSHPGCTLQDAVELAIYLKKHRIRPQQVQDFYPTPGTMSTCMYFCRLDPRDMTPVHVPTDEEKRMQRALMQTFLPANAPLVRKALARIGRRDLIGFGPNALVPPEKPSDTGKKPEKTAPGRKIKVDKQRQNR